LRALRSSVPASWIPWLLLAWPAGCSRTNLDELETPVPFDAGGAPLDGAGAPSPSDASVAGESRPDVAAPDAEPLEVSTPSGPGTGPLPDPSICSSYLINPAHTGSIEDPTLTPPLVRVWKVDFSQPVSYPLIAGGLVYVVVAGAYPSGDSSLVALDAQTGAGAWGPAYIGKAYSLAFDNGRIFTLDSDTFVTAFDAMTGQRIWRNQLVKPPYAGEATAAPTAYRGIVYASVSNGVTAADERDGTVLWWQTVWGGDISSPAVSDLGAFASYFCGQNYANDRISGMPLWHNAGPCTGADGATPVLYDGTLFTRDDFPPGNLRLDATNGAVEGPLASTLAPAFHGSRGYYVSETAWPGEPTGTLSAVDLTSQAVQWTFSGDGALSTAPVVVGGQVIVGSRKGTVFGVDETSGALSWSDDTGAPLVGEGTQAATPSVVAIGAAEGIVVVPAGSSLVGYAHANATGEQ
jgi:outer membrane protein assembly factor BamB